MENSNKMGACFQDGNVRQFVCIILDHELKTKNRMKYLGRMHDIVLKYFFSSNREENGIRQGGKSDVGQIIAQH